MPNEFELEIQKFSGNFDELIRSIKNKRIIFFVGSGISSEQPTDIDSAKDLSRRLKENFSTLDFWKRYFDKTQLTPEEEKKRFYSDPADLPKLEEIAELFLRNNRYRDFIDGLVDDQQWKILSPNTCHTILSELMIEEFYPAVITTNQDNRIEIKHDEIATNDAIRIVSHDDYRNREGMSNNLYKVHGCLFFCPTKKYESIWASSQFAQAAWPTGVKFGEDKFIDFVKQGYKIIFVGFKAYLQYLTNSIAKSIQEGGTYGQFYCIGRRDFDKVISEGEEEEKKFIASIQLPKERYCRAEAGKFFRMVRYFAFEKMLQDLYHNNSDLKGDQFHGGNHPCFRIPISGFNTSIDLLKEDVLKADREVFQKFLRLVLHENDTSKYISFKHRGDRIGRLFYILALFRFNYILNFCENKYCHLIIKKGNFEAKLIIINGRLQMPLQLIFESVNREMTENFEMRRNVENVFVYDASDYSLMNNSSGTGRMIAMASPEGKITDGAGFNVNRLSLKDLLDFLNASADRETFNQKLDSISWRN